MPCHNHSRYPSYPHMLLLNLKKYIQNCEFILFLDWSSCLLFPLVALGIKLYKGRRNIFTERIWKKNYKSNINVVFLTVVCGEKCASKQEKAVPRHHHQTPPTSSHTHTHTHSPSLLEFSTSTQYATFHHHHYHCFVHTFLQMMKIRCR